MRIVNNLIISLAIILNSIDLCLQFDCLPNGVPIPGVLRSETSYSPGRNSPERCLPPAEPSPRARPKSSPARHLPPLVLKYELDNLNLIRLIPLRNPHQIFEIQKYTFPADKPIQIKLKYNSLGPMPTGEQKVLTTSTGDVFAIVVDNRRLRGIYTRRHFVEYRVKINMFSGKVEDMTPEEMEASPLGPRNTIAKTFRLVNVNNIPRRH